jgi:hypothetical protein
MPLAIDVEKLPRNVLETAIKLNDPLKNIYITLLFWRTHSTKKDGQKAGIRKSIRPHAAMPTRIHGFSQKNLREKKSQIRSNSLTLAIPQTEQTFKKT